MPDLIRSVFLLALLTCTGCNGYSGSEKLAAESTGDLSHPLATHVAPDLDQRKACGDGGPTSAGEEALLRAPFVQQVGPTDALLVWRTYAPEEASVRVWRADGVEEKAPAVTRDATVPDGAGAQYVAKLGGLEPEAIYCYQVVGRKAPLTAPAGLRTAPRVGDDAAVRFAVFGDSGTGGEAQLALAEQLGQLPYDFILHTGDVAYNASTTENLTSLFFGVYGHLLQSIPAYAASGNHDYKAARAEPLRRALVLPENGGADGRERWYSFDRGPVHVVVLDSEDDTRQQATWLARDLAANRLPWVVVALHRPPYSSGKHGSSSLMQERFVPLFEKYGVALVVSGHEHSYERTKPLNGVTYVVTGAGGRGVRSVGTSAFTAFSEAVNHVVLVEVEGDALVLHAFDATGAEFDSARIERPAGP